MLTLSITQISENKDTKKYQWTIRENYKLIDSGKVNAPREDEWEELVHMILEERGECPYKDFHEQNYP